MHLGATAGAQVTDVPALALNDVVGANILTNCFVSHIDLNM